MINNGVFVISLDFEMFWGVHHTHFVNRYLKNLESTPLVVPRLLQTFEHYNIHATWATVGLLFNKSFSQLTSQLPAELPTYNNPELNPFRHLNDDARFPEEIYCAPKLVQSILQTPHQELASHTYSHFYCLEPGQTASQFEADLIMAKSKLQEVGQDLHTLVFPVNQLNPSYLSILQKLGVACYRGNPNNWLYKAVDEKHESLFRRMIRLMDSYFNLSGYHCYDPKSLTEGVLTNIPASRFLRPFPRRLKFLENLRFRRIEKAMTHAAKNNLVFHLWWHPHNFGDNTDHNFQFLSRILALFQMLNQKYQMQSMNMLELTQRLRNEEPKRAEKI